MILKDIVKFRGDKLFNGAVNIDWYSSDAEKSRMAAEAFVFHGPAYHGISPHSPGHASTHNLIDTASFAKTIIKRAYAYEDIPFTLAIAGYGTGKSHLGVTLAELMGAPKGTLSDDILSNIASADRQIAEDIKDIMDDTGKPCLVIALNGLNKFDFVAGLSSLIIQVLQKDGHDANEIKDLRPRFKQAIDLIKFMGDSKQQEELFQFCDNKSIENIVALLEQQDEDTFKDVSKFFAKHNIQPRNLQGESVQDLIRKTVEVYCGENKPYQCLVILFDEFGKYMEFASTKSHLAGSGVLQELFESIQNYSPLACFVGFIQFELNAYLQRMALEHKNEMQRYITRFQTADKLYLSTNLETLIANLIEKKDSEYLAQMFDIERARQNSDSERKKINRWFPSSKHTQVWNDPQMFHNIISKGAWPLSAFSLWLLNYLSAVGGHLQERSALALLIEVFKEHESMQMTEDKAWRIAAADIVNNSFIQELLSAEESGAQGTIIQSYQTVMSKYSTKYSINQIKILKAIVLSSKLGLVAVSKYDAIEALQALTNMDAATLDSELKTLLDEYNAIEWDEVHKSFDILSDALPRTHFINHIRRHLTAYDENTKSRLFVSSIKDNDWLLKQDIDSVFAADNKIITTEWSFKAKIANLDTLATQIKSEAERWSNAESVDEPRGSIIYVYLGESKDYESIAKEAKKWLRDASDSHNVKAIPILLMFLYDIQGNLGQYLAELAIIHSLSTEDRTKFGNLVDAHIAKTHKLINEELEALLRERRYVSLAEKQTEGLRLNKMATELFKQIYTRPITFPFDGFSTSKGNAADSCSKLTRELMHSTLDHSTIMAKPPKDKNRATCVLDDAWGVILSNGKISRRPNNNILKNITIKWDEKIKERMLSLREMYDTLIKPPYGANQDSAGLFLGVYISPRSSTLHVFKNNQYISIKQWADDTLIKARHFNPAILEDAYLVSKSDETSEWESLLEEWEQAENHLAKISCLQRSEKMKEKLPVPSELYYREDRLCKGAKESKKIIDEMECTKEQATILIMIGTENKNVSKLSEGSSILKDLIEKLESEKPHWIDEQIDALRPTFIEGRQTIIQVFPDWLETIAPASESPEDVGDFKHRMLNEVKAQLLNIGLDEQAKSLDSKVRQQIRNVENVAEANRMVSDVSNWITSNQNISSGRIKDIKNTKKTAKDYSNKLRGMYQRVKQENIQTVRKSLNDFLGTLAEIENKITERANKVWKSKLTDQESINEQLDEIDSLIRAYDGMEEDLDDFNEIRKALSLFKRAVSRLDDISLNWTSFDNLVKDVEQESIDQLIDKELPWMPEDVIKNIVKNISDYRTQQSNQWTDRILEQEAFIAEMDAPLANQLQNTLSAPPAYITDTHKKKLNKLKNAVETRLSEIKIEWVVEKFNELSEKDKKQVLKLISPQH